MTLWQAILREFCRTGERELWDREFQEYQEYQEERSSFAKASEDMERQSDGMLSGESAHGEVTANCQGNQTGPAKVREKIIFFKKMLCFFSTR